MTQENSTENKNKLLVGVVVLLALGLVFETGYLLIKSKSNSSSQIKDRYVAEGRDLAPPARHSRGGYSSPAAAAWDMDRYDPFAEMDRMQEQMNRMFNESFRHASSLMGPGPIGTGIPKSFFEPGIDLQDKTDHYLITMDIPGMEKDQINLAVKEHMLTVSGDRKSESEKKDEKQGFYSMERQFGSFARTIPLPDDADGDRVKANYEKGVLEIEIPKLAQKTPVENNVKKVPVQ